MSNARSDTYVRLLNALASYPRGDVKPPKQWPDSKTHRVTCANQRPSEAEWLRRLALS